MTRALVAVSDPTYGGVYYSTNIDFTDLTTQPTWTKMATTGLANTLIKVMRVDPENPYDNIYLQLDNDNVYRWNGVSWTLIMTLADAQVFLPGGDVGYIATNQITAGKVYWAIQTVGQVRLLYSSDYGATWAADTVDTDIMTGDAYVAAYGDNIVVCTGEIYRMAYTGAIGSLWPPMALWNNSGGGATIRIDPADPQYFYYRKDSSDADLIRAGLSTITEIQDGYSLASNIDWHEHMHWIDPAASAHQRILRSLSNNVSVYSTTDSWATFVDSTPTVLKTGFLKAVGALHCARENSDYCMFGVTEQLGSQGIVEAFVGDNPTQSYIIAGTNWNTSPYTNAIPYTADAHVAFSGIWVGEGINSAVKGVYVYSVETGVYDYDHHPMIGDRSAHHTLSYPDEHAEDVQKDTPYIHTPFPTGNDGYGIIEVDGKWVNSDEEIITSGDISTLNNALHDHITNEDHTDECNGVATQFYPDHDFIPMTMAVYLNGLRQRLYTDYTEAISLDSITMTTAPENGDILLFDYLYDPAEGFMARRVLISEQTPTGTGTVTWSSIPATYKSLEIEYTARSTQVATSSDMALRFNNDTTDANYQRFITGGTGASTAVNSGADDALIGGISAASATAGEAGTGFIKIIGYAGTTFKKSAIIGLTIWTGTTQSATRYSTNLSWESTAAINRVDIVLAAGNYDTGSTFRLYGVY